MPGDTHGVEAAWRARLALGFERRGERCVLASREHDGPLVVQKPLYPEGEAVCHAIVVHPPAGIAGGDELLIDVAAREGAHALLTTPGAGKWYRSAGPWALQRVQLDVARGASMEWLPQETIVYDGAKARIAWHASIASDARLVGWDIVCLGRTGRGETFASGACRIDASIIREGRIAWRERALIGGDTLAHSAAGLGSHAVFGTLVAAAPEIGDECVALAREAAPREGESGVTCLPGLLLARYRGDSTQAARAYFVAVWERLRPAIMGREAVEPRIWRT